MKKLRNGALVNPAIPDQSRDDLGEDNTCSVKIFCKITLPILNKNIWNIQQETSGTLKNCIFLWSAPCLKITDVNHYLLRHMEVHRRLIWDIICVGLAFEWLISKAFENKHVTLGAVQESKTDFARSFKFHIIMIMALWCTSSDGIASSCAWHSALYLS